MVVARNLEQIYDIPTALRAFALVRRDVPGARLTVAGSGPGARGAGLACDRTGHHWTPSHFSGRLDRDEMAELTVRPRSC